MDQVKIGRFIAERRRSVKLTQAQLAERLCITDRAVSKWETGKAMPDSSIMLELCGILGITANDLLSGEVISMEGYDKKAEENLLELARAKEAADRRLLSLEILIVLLASLFLCAAVLIASLVPMPTLPKVALILLTCAVFAISLFYAFRIEQVAGYFQCKKCGHRHVPSYRSILFAMHLNRTRYLRCPHCGKWAWHKKVIK